MTLTEAVRDYQYDVDIYYCVDDEQEGWCWEVNGGYCQTWSKEIYQSIKDAYKNLIDFLEAFTGYDK